MIMEKATNKVNIQGKMSPAFEVVIGPKYGNALSKLLFHQCLEKVIRNVKTNPGETVFNKARQCLLCTNDVVVLGL
jgi:hypothetical protein